MIIDKITQKFFITLIINGCFIRWCLSKYNSNPQLIGKCSNWNISAKTVIFGQINMTAGNDDDSLNLSNSSLDINRETGAIAVLDDNNRRVLVFNQSNSSTLFAILFNSSNSTNTPMTNLSLSAIVYDHNSSLYILDGWEKDIMKMNNPLKYGENAISVAEQYSSPSNLSFNINPGGLCVDNTDGSFFISDIDNHRIIRYKQGTSNITTYVGTGTAGNASNQLYMPTSIVIDDNQRLFVNDVGNKRIQMFEFNSTNGITLSRNIDGWIGLGLYFSEILIMNTKTVIYLLNLTDYETTCAIGCYDSELNNIHNALIDNDGNLIVTDSNQVLQYPTYQQCSYVSPNFVPVNNCPPRKFGIGCTSSENICDITQPCLNSGLCIENETIPLGYICECPSGFEGSNCENDERPCQPFTCFQRGNCTTKSSTQFECQCISGYEGQRCEVKVDFCANITCQNSGVCFQEYLNYSCNCLSGFSGRFCEKTDTSTVVRGYVSKGFGYVAIIMLLSLIGFIILMDVLRYVFGIDPVKSNRKGLQKKYEKTFKKKNQAKEPIIVYRFQYVN